MVTQNVTLDGSTSFSAFGETESWSGRYNEYVRIDNAGSVTADTLNMTLTGASWEIRRMAFDSASSSAPLNVNITDANDGVERRINWLQLQDFGTTTLTLFNSEVRFLEAGEGSTVNLTFGSGRLDHADLWDTANATVTFGSGGVLTLNMGDGTNVVNAGSGNIQSLEMGEGTNTFNGGTGDFGIIRAWGATNTLTFQNGGDSLFVGEGTNLITLNAGRIASIVGFTDTASASTISIGANAAAGSIRFSDGRETLTVSGEVNQADLNAGNDTVNVTAGGNIEFLAVGDGNDTVTVTGTNSSIDTLNLGRGTNKLVINAGGQVNMLRADGNDTVTLKGDARILVIKMDQGTNALSSGTGFIESFYSHEARNTLNIGTGGIGEILITGSPAAQTITASGWVGSLQVYAGNLAAVQASTVTLGAGGAGYIQTSKGNDVITAGAGSVVSINTYDGADRVTVGAGGVDSINTGIGNDTINATGGFADVISAGDGNDSVTTGSSGAGYIALGAGNDTLAMTRFTPADTMIVAGGAGADTVNMTGFAAALRVSLAQPGLIQNVGALAGVTTPALGFVGLSGVENLIGTIFNDWFQGGAEANVLTGMRGADTLYGLGGADVLAGGIGNDSLFGGAGADRFVFATGDGTDLIADFVSGVDKVELREANALADLTFTQVGADVRVVFGTWTGIFEDITVADLRVASNFLF